MKLQTRSFTPSPTHVLLALLAAAVLMRAALIAAGVQDTPDDVRYLRALSFYNTRDFGAFLSYYDHLGFTLISLVPAALQRNIALATGQSINQWFSIPAAVLSLSSVACIGLLYGIARRAGAKAKEALCVALLALLTSSLFYWTPYTLPYDVSMATALWALFLSMGRRMRPARLFWIGLLIGFALLTYSAHWILCGVVLVVASLWPLFKGRQSLAHLFRRAACIGGGFAAPFAVLFLLTSGRYLTGMLQFSETVTQGAFQEGWSLPFEVFYHAEHGLLLIWGIGLAAALGALFRHRSPRARRIILWGSALIFVYALLVLGSVVFERFVVYGRTARQMIPFILLVVGAGWAALPGLLRSLPLHPTASRLPQALLIAAALLALPNLIRPFALDAPRDAGLRALATAGDAPIGVDFTVTGSYADAQTFSPPNARYTLFNAATIAFVTGTKPLPEGSIIFRMTHPLQFEPNLYEGAPPAERAILRQAILDMILLERPETSS